MKLRPSGRSLDEHDRELQRCIDEQWEARREELTGAVSLVQGGVGGEVSIVNEAPSA